MLDAPPAAAAVADRLGHRAAGSSPSSVELPEVIKPEALKPARPADMDSGCGGVSDSGGGGGGVCGGRCVQPVAVAEAVVTRTPGQSQQVPLAADTDNRRRY